MYLLAPRIKKVLVPTTFVFKAVLVLMIRLKEINVRGNNLDNAKKMA